jgi:hypothetical protein
VGYIDVREGYGSRDILGYLVWCLDASKVSKALLGSLVGYMVVPEGSMGLLFCQSGTWTPQSGTWQSCNAQCAKEGSWRGPWPCLGAR